MPTHAASTQRPIPAILDSMPRPGEMLPAARLIIHSFSYVFVQFLPRYPAAVRDEAHARIFARAMRAFDGRHLLGWRSFRVLRHQGAVAAVAVVTPQASGTDHFLRTALAFTAAVAVTAPLQLPGCLLRAWQARELLQAPPAAPGDMALLYLATDSNCQRLGLAGRLLGSVQQQASAHQVSGLVAAVRRHNHAARTFFAAMGFTEQRKEAAPETDLLLYRRALDQPTEP